MGVERDLKTAYKYYEKAGALKSGKALCKQATFLIKGIGTDHANLEEALAMFEKAGDFGDEEAYNFLGYISISIFKN
jgi:TPR repeat protein